jgi:chromate reductase
MAVHVIGIIGSLRAGSYNRALMNVAMGLLPEGMTLEIGEIADIPLYNADVEAQGIPGPVQRLKEQVAAADALLIATPEYNYSIPGVLKNAIDWISRPPDPPLNGKPTAIMGASMGIGGTIRSQLHLRQVAVFTNMLVLNKPELIIPRAQEKFMPDGQLTDPQTREVLGRLLLALRDWTARIGKGR